MPKQECYRDDDRDFLKSKECLELEEKGHFAQISKLLHKRRQDQVKAGKRESAGHLISNDKIKRFYENAKLNKQKKPTQPEYRRKLKELYDTGDVNWNANYEKLAISLGLTAKQAINWRYGFKRSWKNTPEPKARTRANPGTDYPPTLDTDDEHDQMEQENDDTGIPNDVEDQYDMDLTDNQFARNEIEENDTGNEDMDENIEQMSPNSVPRTLERNTLGQAGTPVQPKIVNGDSEVRTEKNGLIRPEASVRDGQETENYGNNMSNRMNEVSTATAFSSTSNNPVRNGAVFFTPEVPPVQSSSIPSAVDTFETDLAHISSQAIRIAREHPDRIKLLRSALFSSLFALDEKNYETTGELFRDLEKRHS